MKNILKNDKGLSLIEILVALTLASIILLVTNMTFRTIVFSIKKVTGASEFYENISLAYLKIDKDITNIYFKNTNKNLSFIGEIKGENSVLNFVTVNHRDLNISGDLSKSNPVSDINEIGYYLKEDKEYNGVFFLMRREQNYYDDEPDKGGDADILLENMVRLKFEFKKGNDWVDKWDSRETKNIPQAIRTTIVAKSYSKQEEKFVFISKSSVDK